MEREGGFDGFDETILLFPARGVVNILASTTRITATATERDDDNGPTSVCGGTGAAAARSRAGDGRRSQKLRCC